MEELAKWCGEEGKVLERASNSGTRRQSPSPPAEGMGRRRLFEETPAAYEELHAGSRASCPFPIILLWSRRARC